ncbi:GYF domain-containing protein [Rhodopirellula sp. MGV]|uniref:GYF domain-containing protein n=1 Tax=Rhodopirellula sp. MGV TaxID=2023130 RepID=UPI0011AF0C21|nr:GYF domain-containing protein [Rhodopirellula sp. MGV]
MALWFLQRLEGNVKSEVGPMQPRELLALVRRGEIKPETMLRKDDSAWFPASEVGGLFEAAYRPEINYYCPSCGKQISQPPVTCANCLHDVGAKEAREVKQAIKAIPSDPKVAKQSSADDGQRSVQSWLRNKVARKQK